MEDVYKPEALTFKVVRFDDAFPRIPKSYHVPSFDVSFPEASLLSPNRAWEYLRHDTYTVPEDFVAILENVWFCSTNNVVLPRLDCVLLESMNGPETFRKTLAPVPSSASEDIETITGHATLLKSNFNEYYHQVVEFFPRLLALNRPPFTAIDEIVLLYSGRISSSEAYMISKLRDLNLRVLELEPGRIYRVERMLFTPFKTRQFGGYLPRPYVDALRRIAWPKRPSAQSYRIFISRERAEKRRMTNVGRLVDALFQLGFESYALEELSPQQQIDLFYDAEVVVGAHGGGLSNLVFSSRVKVLELFPRDFVVPHYMLLCKALGHPYRYWCADVSRWDAGAIASRIRRWSVGGIADRVLAQAGVPRRVYDGSFKVDVPAILGILASMGVEKRPQN